MRRHASSSASDALGEWHSRKNAFGAVLLNFSVRQCYRLIDPDSRGLSRFKSCGDFFFLNMTTWIGILKIVGDVLVSNLRVTGSWFFENDNMDCYLKKNSGMCCSSSRMKGILVL